MSDEIDGLGLAINRCANTLRRKKSEPRVAARLFTAAPQIVEVELAARAALRIMQGLVDNNAVRLPYPGFAEAVKALKKALPSH